MKLSRIRIHNYRSIINADIEAHDFTLLVGANNAGKSNIVNALRCFYGDLSWTENDSPKMNSNDINDEKSWVELSFILSDNEWNALEDKYKKGVEDHRLVLKRHFNGDKAKAKQSNIYAIVNGVEYNEIFYKDKSTIPTKCGRIIYIPALTTPNEQMKTSGPSPLRQMLNFMLSRIVPNSPAYAQLEQAFMQLNQEANRENGFLTRIAQPLNEKLNQWDVQIDLSINQISPEVITKSLFSYTFADKNIGNTGFGLDRFGHGFQRAVIYELIRLASGFQQESKTNTNEFDPNYTLLLFEEPEAFLHPAQQENMAYHLRRFSQNSGQQVIVTSHSPVFVSKNCDDLKQICRIHKLKGISKVYQLKHNDEEILFNARSNLLAPLSRFIDDPNVSPNMKIEARKLLKNAPSDEEIANQYEKFRFQLWLDSDCASMFFADKVLLVEGHSEKMLFNYLLANDWHVLTKERILVVVALGKYNFLRFINLFAAYGIRYGIIMDNDHNKNLHAVINSLIRKRNSELKDFSLSEPFEFDENLENYLGLTSHVRDDQKPLQILQVLHEHKLKENKNNSDFTHSQLSQKLSQLLKVFCRVLDIQTDRNLYQQ